MEVVTGKWFAVDVKAGELVELLSFHDTGVDKNQHAWPAGIMEDVYSAGFFDRLCQTLGHVLSPQ